MIHFKNAAAVLTKISGVALDVKAVGDDGTIEGYGSVFGNVDSYGEVVEPGAFTASLVDAKRKGRTIKMLWQHNPDQPIGVWEDLAEDAKGLYVKGHLLKDVSSTAAEAYGLVKGGAVDGLSIGYRELDAEPDDSRPNIRRLLKLDLREVSIVTFAANERARIDSVKHLLTAGELPTVREFEETLRELGFSRKQAAALASSCAPHLRGDPEAKADPMVAFWHALRG
jgi:HK97 family phage prohead protease